MTSPLFKQVTYVLVLVGNGSETVNVYYHIPLTLTQQYPSDRRAERVDLVILHLFRVCSLTRDSLPVHVLRSIPIGQVNP
jgi:hypothetical protein